MSFDFAAILVMATLVTGIIWLVDIMLWAPARGQQRQRLITAGADSEKIADSIREPLLVEYARAFFPVILAVLVLRSFIVEPFRIPSNSMMPTLLTGDFILVNKFTYGIRLPVIDKKIIAINEPKRGDVIVFRYPNDPSIDYIKRVVGLPGDHISYHQKTLRINGETISQEPVGTYTGVGASAVMTGASLSLEKLGTVEHSILIRPGQLSPEGDYTVPLGEYFAMGDNRDNSSDSRVWGFVPEQNLVGKAFLIWMNWDLTNPNGVIGWKRMGSSIE